MIQMENGNIPTFNFLHGLLKVAYRREDELRENSRPCEIPTQGTLASLGVTL